MLKFRLFSDHVDQAYCLSKENFTRPIAIEPKQEGMHILGVEHDEVLKLQRSSYGLCDTADYWGITISSYIKGQMKMILTIADLSL